LPIEYSFWIIAGSAVVFVIALIVAIIKILVKIEQMTKTATEIKQDIQRLSLESSVLIQSTDETMRMIKESVHAAQGLVHATKQVGQTIDHTTAMVEKVTNALSEKAITYVEKEKTNRHLDEALQWTELALSAWQLWNDRKAKLAAVTEQKQVDI